MIKSSELVGSDHFKLTLVVGRNNLVPYFEIIMRLFSTNPMVISKVHEKMMMVQYKWPKYSAFKLYNFSC